MQLSVAPTVPEDSVMVVEPPDGATDGSPSLSDGPPSVRPPTVTSPTELPFHELEWGNFERLCQDTARNHGFTNVHRHGRPGQSQDGVDFTGVSPTGESTAFQVKRKEKLSAGELESAVRDYADGAVAARTTAFVVCMSAEANERNLQDKLATLNERHNFPIKLWDAVELTNLLHDKDVLVGKFFGQQWAEVYFGTSSVPRQRLDSEALLIGPVQALGLTAKVEEAERLAQTSPMDAAKVYEAVAGELRARFPGHADRFDLLRAACLKRSGSAAASHDALTRIHRTKLDEAGCRAAGEFGGRAGVRRAAPGAGRSQEPSLSTARGR